MRYRGEMLRESNERKKEEQANMPVTDMKSTEVEEDTDENEDEDTDENEEVETKPSRDPDDKLPAPIRMKIKEAEAIASVIRELAELPEDAIRRVFKYVGDVLGIGSAQAPSSSSFQARSNAGTKGPTLSAFIREHGTASMEQLMAAFALPEQVIRKRLTGSINLGMIKEIEHNVFRLNIISTEQTTTSTIAQNGADT
jgi:hypothetical protein